jgi:nucleotide-binding universal stress UspA family protein
MNSDYRIVVGVDGSDDGARALQWAVREAATRGGTVQAVTALTFDSVESSSIHQRDQHRERVERMLGGQVSAALNNDSRVAITTRVVFGSPVDALTDTARGADLLVLRGRRRRRLLRPIHRSIVARCIHAGGCPVVVVPAAPAPRVPAAARPTGIPSAIL